jgi:hypothetical protein
MKHYFSNKIAGFNANLQIFSNFIYPISIKHAFYDDYLLCYRALCGCRNT